VCCVVGGVLWRGGCAVAARPSLADKTPQQSRHEFGGTVQRGRDRRRIFGGLGGFALVVANRSGLHTWREPQLISDDLDSHREHH
jgi:hypothetical protein